MKIIEQNIDKIVQVVENDESIIPDLMDRYSQSQPSLVAYLISDNFSLLTQEEKQYFEYLGLLIMYVLEEHIGEMPQRVSPINIEKKEEKNWELLNQNEKAKFRDKLTPFFEKSKEEDLYAFVEDSLVVDEAGFPSAAGRELIFVGLATLIDVVLDVKKIAHLSGDK